MIIAVVAVAEIDLSPMPMTTAPIYPTLLRPRPEEPDRGLDSGTGLGMFWATRVLCRRQTYGYSFPLMRFC